MPYDKKKNQEELDALMRELRDVLITGRKIDADNHQLLAPPLSRSDQIVRRQRDPWGYWCDDLARKVAEMSSYFHHDEYGRADVGETALFGAQLKHYIAEFFGEHYPMTMCRNWLTVDNSLPVGAMEYSARRMLHHGEMKAVATYGGDAPVITVGAAEDTYKNVEYQGKIVHTLAQLEHCAYAGFPLETEQLNALALAAEMNFEERWHIGDPEFGTLGYYLGAAVSNIPLYVAVTGAWAGATHDQMLGDVRALMYGIRLATNVSLLYPDSIVIPSILTQYLGTRRANTDLSVRAAIEQEYPGIRIFESQRADLYDAAGTGPRILAFASSRVASRFGEPRRLEMLAAQQIGARFESVGRQNIAGAILPQPLAMGHMDGC